MKKYLLMLGMLAGLSGRAAVPIDTVVYTDKAGNHFTMIVVGDRVPSLFKNNQKIQQEDFGRYEDIIGILQEKLIEKWKANRKK
jgi:hypothetical protein